jgi:hypothetical protein
MSFRSEYDYIKSAAQLERRKQAIKDEIATMEFLKKESSEDPLATATFNQSLSDLRKQLSRLEMQPAHPVVAKAIQQQAKPLYVFNASEIEKINQRYEEIPASLKEIMDAALLDKNTLGLIEQPVFIRRDDKIYSLKFLLDWLGDAEEKRHPEDDSKTFKRTDIIPCNTLIKAMQVLLQHLDGEDVKSHLTTLSPPQNVDRKRLTAEHIVLIEKVYASLEPHRQVLFDCICRDPETKIILDDPVFLPNGRVYERSTAQFYLDHYQGRCPGNENIIFAAEDIVPCCFVINVLDQLRLDAENLMKIKREQAALQKVPIANAELSSQRDIQIETLLILARKTQKKLDEKEDKTANEDMVKVLDAAVRSLMQLDVSILNEAKKTYPRFDVVKTWLAGSQSSESSWGHFYRGIAVKMGTVNHQLGKDVGDHVKAVETLLGNILRVDQRNPRAPVPVMPARF